MSTVGELIDATLNRWLYGTYKTKTNVTADLVDDQVADIAFKYPANTVGEGSLLALGDELCEVTRAVQNQTTVNVIRGVRGTLADTHPAGTPVEINPRYPRLNVRAAMLDEIIAWPETLGRVTQIEATPGIASLDISALTAPAKVRRVLDVTRSSRTISDDRWFSADWHSIKDARFPGSCDIYFNNRQSLTCRMRSYRVVVSADFVTDNFDDDTDLQDDVGVARTLEDVLQLGCAWRLVTGREAKRLYTEAQGESRDAAEVGSLDPARFGIQLMQMRDAGIAREAKRLKDRYGVGITGS